MTPAEAVFLANTLAKFEGVTHWAISQRIFGKGNFFEGIKNGSNTYHSTLERAHRWFGDNWPEDLAWPDAIERPARVIERERVA